MAGRGRSDADERLAAEIAAGKTIVDAAAASGVSERTARRRLAEPEFQARVRELRSAMVTAAAGKLADAMTQAADVLRRLLESEDEGIQFKSASKLIELSLKVNELTELQDRVKSLEMKLGGAAA